MKTFCAHIIMEEPNAALRVLKEQRRNDVCTYVWVCAYPFLMYGYTY